MFCAYRGDLKIDAQRVTKKQVTFISFYIKKREICEDLKRKRNLDLGLISEESEQSLDLGSKLLKKITRFVYSHFLA